MIQPGRETNIPTSSGRVGSNGTARAIGMTPLLKFDGVTLTLGMVAVALILLFVYYRWFAKKGRK